MRKKQITELSITGVLVVVLLSAILQAAKKGRQSRVLPETKVYQAEAAGIFKRLDDESKNLELKRDPFSGAPIIIEEASSSISLNGILWDENNPMAIINDEVVKTGGRVGAYAVIEIRKDSVILNDGASDLELKL